LWRGLSAAAVACVCLYGLALQLRLGAANLQRDLTKDNFNYPEIEAARWIDANSPSSAVVMARKDDVVYHYSHRRVIWFPPSRDPRMLMDGIRRHHVRYIVVHYGNDWYWRPPAEECFSLLSYAYPRAFQLVHTGPHNSIYEVGPYFRSESFQSLSLAGGTLQGP